MRQSLALEVMLSGRNVFLTGAAGSGKTYLLNRFIELAKKQGKKVSVTATTGLAATHLGGNTIHAWSGVGILDFLSSKFVDNLSKARQDTIKNTDVLVIDEISMLHDFRLDMVEEVCRLVRQNDEAFGGIQIVLCGDFFQLPPINRPGSKFGNFAIHSEAWRKMSPVICYLEKNFRQDDDRLTEILNALRANNLRRHHVESLLSRLNVQLDDESEITELHTANIDVDKINQERLDQIEESEKVFFQSTTGASNYVKTLQKSVLAPEALHLKKGALVMAVKNSLNRQFVNGSIGEVIGFESLTDYPIVKFHNGKTVVIVPDTWELKDGSKKRASITQIPLRLAYAITIHKSQGMTLDSAVINLQKAFTEGMGYVALSRVRALDRIYLTGINKMALQVSSEAQKIDAYLREESSISEKEFSYLLEKPQVSDLDSKQSKTSWSDRLAEMRKQFPNAYKTWTTRDDADLCEGFSMGKTVTELSRELGRHERSIIIRLKKHFGEDIQL